MMMTVQCAVCGKDKQIQACHLKRTKQPTCSRHCNGILRGQEWKQHAHKGRAAWTAKSEASYREKMSGENNPSWNGGSYIEPEKGYRMVRLPNHHRARANGYVLEHIVVAEQILGRRLKADEEVHHKDHDRSNNEPSNLKIYDSHLEHWTVEHLTDVHAARDAAASRKRSARAPR